MLIYAKNKSQVEKIRDFKLSEEDKEKYSQHDDISFYDETSYMRTGNNSNRVNRPNLFYPIYYCPKNGDLSLEPSDESVELLPINMRGEEKTWRWGKETFLENQKTELFVKLVKGKFRIFKKRRITINTGKKPKTVWYNPKYDASSNGIVLLQNILGRENPFPYPKSLYTIYDIIYILTNEDSIILDFFAGSGTTGHAILELNKKYNSKRKYILVTNNEDNNGNGSGIAESICYPRIKKVIEGYKNLNGKEIKGLGSNLKYYKTDFVPFAHTDSDKRALTNKSTEMLCLAEETYNAILFNNGEFSLFENESKITAIIYDEDFIEDCKFELNKFHKDITIYVFSYDKEYNPEDFSDLDGKIRIKPIPEAILNIYRKIGRK
jgi:adenine-specific DNA-methyltransferase